MTILNVGYGTTDPQELLHLVQSNVTLILQDSRNNNEGTANLEFIQGPGNFGENSHIDWKLSNSNSTFCIKRAANNITSNVVVVNENGNVTVSNDMLVQGEFIRQGVNIYYHFENIIDNVNSSLENELDSTSNILFIQSSNFTVNTSNYVLKIEDEVNDRIDNANTYSLNTSNIISNRITNLSADKIANGNNNKFIVNGIYSNDFEVYGNLTASNLTIHGTTTTLNTDLYVTEQLDIQNNSDSVALNIIQHHSSSDVVNIATNTTQLLTLKNDGKFGIGTTVPAFTLDLNATDGIKLPSGGEDTKPDNLVSSNYGLIRYNTDLKTFEGYGHGGSSGAWSSLGGVKDVDADTYISAENNAGDDNDELKFFTSNLERMVITSNGLIGIGTESPAFSLDINATDGLKLPAGDEAQRPDSSTIVKGVIRYNTESDQFEGYGAGNAWGSLGGVKDVDGDTYISAENNAGDDNDELKFYTSSNERMVITSNGLIGIGNTEPSSLLSLSGDDTTIKIQDSKNDDTGSTNIELINGPVDSFSDNTNLYNWRISNSNNQYILASGSNNQIYERFIISGETGNVGLGTQPHIFVEGENDEYKMTIKGNINVDGFIYKNGEIYRGEGSVGVISQHMPVQTQSITYTKTRIMTSTESNSQNIVPDNGWRFIDNNLTSGFVIKIKPSHVRSKILLNLSCHVGFDSIPESRWWGLKLYRKIEGLNGGNWTEVSEANGENTTGFSSCWLSHNMGANLSTYENFITNVSGTFFDEPFKGISSDIKTVYYTVKWKSNLGTYNTNSGGGELYFNRPAVLLDTSNSPVLSSSWSAQEVWQLGTPYIPGEASNVITIFDQDFVGIGNTEPQYELDVGGDINITGTYLLNNVDVFTYTSNYILRIDGEVNTRLDGVDNVDNILGFFRDTEFEKDDSDFINIKKASATNIGGIMVDNDTITIDEFGVISGSQNIDLSGYATKSYVDGIASGLVFKDSAKVATITNIASLSGTQVIDGVSVVSGDRVLVKNQSIQSENGIYICSTSAWSRSTDFDQSSDNIGAFVFIDAGNTNSGTSFVCSNDSAITIGTTDVIFTKFTSSGQLIPDNGLIQNGNEISINAKTNGGIIFENKKAIIDLAASLLEGVLPASKGGTGKNTLDDSITLGQHTIGKYVSTITAGNGLSTSGADTEISTHTLSIDAKTNGGLVIENHQLAINLSAGSITGTLAISDGGTGATTAAAARTALDVDISGTDNSTDVTLASVNENYLTINDQTITARQVPISLGGTGANTLDNLITLGSHTTGYFVSTITAGNGLATTGIDEELSAHTLSIDPKIGGGVVIENNKLAIDLSADSITGTLAISDGGTGTDSLTTDIIPPGTSNQFIVNDTIVPNDTVSKNIIVSGNILPSQNETFNLGSPEYKWNSLYVAANTINIGNTKISASEDGGLAMNIIKFEERINNITSNELHSLTGISKNIQEQISELNLDIIADGTSNKFIVDDCYNGSMYIASNFYVGKYFSTENPNGNLHVYGDITIEGDINTVNPLITQYHRHLSNYNIGYIDITNVDDTSNKPSIKIEHNVGYSNIMEISCKGDDGIFTISSNGFIGINRKEPMEKLDIDGNVKISGGINNITYQELDKLSGIDYNIKQQIDDNDFNQSNYVLLASNIVFTKSSNFIINTSNYISRIDDDINSRIDTTNLNIITTSNILFLQSSNFDAHASNYILRIDGEVNARLDGADNDITTTSNILFLQSSNFDAHASNYILRIDGEVNDRLDNTDADIITTSNILFLQSSNFDAHASNYILRIDGEVNDRLDNTDADK